MGIQSIAQDTISAVTTDTSAADSSMVETPAQPENLDTDSARLHIAIDAIFEAAKDNFRGQVGGSLGTIDGEKAFKSKLRLPKSDTNYLTINSDRIYTLTSRFEGLQLSDAQAKEKEISAILMKRLKPESFAQSRGTDMKYHQYRFNSFAFDSDNIDDLGKHPTFAVGVVKGTDGTFTVEFQATDPVWR